jgi:hypothetical protein
MFKKLIEKLDKKLKDSAENASCGCKGNSCKNKGGK